MANQSIIPDLSGANLSKANFRDANLSEADLGGANLSDAPQPHFFLMEIASTHYMARSRKRAS
ncbi:pentapeptide repeat-containing protein [Ktedonospora formicarum]|uniref:pentapeptide repeat-containing protein n=1 Tax=Ktedonospora formicarum TaxID=2778364 RepID=UPI003B75D1B6